MTLPSKCSGMCAAWRGARPVLGCVAGAAPALLQGVRDTNLKCAPQLVAHALQLVLQPARVARQQLHRLCGRSSPRGSCLSRGGRLPGLG